MATIELEPQPLPLRPEALEVGSGAGVRDGDGFRLAQPWERTSEDWERLTPRGPYARGLRAPFLFAATLVLVPPALCFALPVALVNLWVQRSARRVLFAQPRVGWRGRTFTLYKFRTMREQPGDDHARVTRFGRFLRNTHLDELPQLWNVLTGDMSLIGPRPEMLATELWAARHCPGFSERLALKPGLTGYAQITQGYTDGGDAAAYRVKRALNGRYRRALGWRLDSVILLRTALWMLRGRGWRKR
ncbi:MAG: sugar transferase [Planctomycetes bacterium]|nr:sugar transferase [Planctomycetota bacterium]